jgi:hypothetical protein
MGFLADLRSFHSGSAQSEKRDHHEKFDSEEPASGLY